MNALAGAARLLCSPVAGGVPTEGDSPMCEQCVGEDAFPRRRFLRLAAAGAVGAAAVASLDSRVAHAKPATRTTPPKTFASVPAPSIVTRAEWGADESIRDRHVIGYA